jgi:Ca-activated chloride channel family protein
LGREKSRSSLKGGATIMAIIIRILFACLASLIFMAFVFQCHPENSGSQSIDVPEREFNREHPDEGVVHRAVLTRVMDGPVLKLNDIREGTMVRRIGETGLYEVLPGLTTEVNISIQGMVAFATVDQVFSNPSENPIEAVYVFPLPQNAAIYDMKMLINDRLIRGLIKERKEAKATYEKAKKEGKRAGIIEQERPNVFTNSVANIMPGDRIMVRIQYVERLAYEDGLFRLRFPMVVAPRYIPGTIVTGYEGTGWAFDTDRVPDASRVTPPVLPRGMRSGNMVSLKVDIHTGLPLERIRSVSHDIDISEHGDSREVVLKKGEVIPNRDFVLEYGIEAGKEPRAALFTARRGDDNYFMLMAVPPVEMDTGHVVSQEMIFVIDISGSMEGASIKQAKSALIRALNGLGPEDYFNVIAFESGYDTMEPGPVAASRGNVQAGIDYVRALSAGGGTEAQPALKEALTMFHRPDSVKVIVFITDGSVGNESDLISLVNSYIGNSRLFTVGIGSAPNGHLLEKISQSGRGTFTYVSNTGEVEETMGGLLSKIEKPVLMDPALDIPEDTEIFPEPIPDLFAGQPLIVFGKTKVFSKHETTLTGKTPEGYFRLQLPLDLDQGRVDPSIPTLWARSKIASFMDEYRLGKREVKEDIIKLAIRHRLLTRFTSFVAVEQKIVNPGGSQSLSAIPAELPEGWVREKVFGETESMKMTALPQTASKMLRKALSGILLLSAGLILLLLRFLRGETDSPLRQES